MISSAIGIARIVLREPDTLGRDRVAPGDIVLFLRSSMQLIQSGSASSGGTNPTAFRLRRTKNSSTDYADYADFSYGNERDRSAGELLRSRAAGQPSTTSESRCAALVQERRRSKGWPRPTGICVIGVIGGLNFSGEPESKDTQSTFMGCDTNADMPTRFASAPLLASGAILAAVVTFSSIRTSPMAAQEGTGTIKGRVTTTAAAAAAVAVQVDEAVCGKTQPDPSLVTSADGGVAWAVVLVTGVKAPARPHRPSPIGVAGSTRTCRWRARPRR